MIKRADASKINREKATKEQIAENFKRLAIDTDKKVELKPSLLKIQKTLDGNTFGIIHENKTYYLKYTTKKGSTNPVDFKHLDGLNSNFGIEKFNSFDKANSKMSFICEAQNNAHKLRLLLEKDENIIDDSEESSDSEEKPKEKVTSDSTEDSLLKNLDKDKQAPAEPAPAGDMGGDMGATPDMGGELPPAPEGGEEAPMDTQPKGDTPSDISTDILSGIGDKDVNKDAEETPAPEGSEEELPAEEPAPEGSEEELPAEEPAPEGGEEEGDPKKEFQEAVGKLGQTINELQDKDQFDEKDIKNVMNSVISAIGSDGFKLVGDKVVDSFIKKIKGSEEKIDNKPADEEEPSDEEMPEEEPAQKLDENILRNLKSQAKTILREQLKAEIIKRKRCILIESIKRKIV